MSQKTALRIILLTSSLFATPSANAGRLFWIDALAGQIRAANLDGSYPHNLIPVGVAHGVSLDRFTGRLYWADNNGWIWRARVTGTAVEAIVPIGSNPTVYGTALDLQGGKIYWTNDLGVAEIQRANLDGSAIQTIVASGMSDPRGIAVDSAGAKVYWTDVGTNDIRRANLDGSSVQILVDFPAAIYPLSIALDVPAGKLYWGDLTTGKIHSANLDGTNVSDVLTPIGSPEVWGIAVDRLHQKLYWSSDSGIYRADLTGTNAEPLVPGQVSVRNMALYPIEGIPATSAITLAALAVLLLALGTSLILKRATIGPLTSTAPLVQNPSP